MARFSLLSDTSDMQTLKERVEFLLKLREMSQADAARAGGLNNAFINDILRGHKESVRGANLAKLTLAFRTTSDFLLGNTEDPEQPGMSVVPTMPQATQAAPSFVPVAFGGTVEAGSFRPVNDFDDDPDRPQVFEPRDVDFPQARLVIFDVAGDSMNNLKPRPILPGDRAIGVDFEDLRGRLPLRDGMVVVVEQTLDGGHHRERSIKQVQLYQDRIEFHPRSTNAKHKPIVVPITVFTDQSEEDRRSVRVLAVIRRISNDLPRL